MAVCLVAMGAAPGSGVVQVAPGVYVRVGATAEASAANADGIANIGFVVGGKCVAVVDPGGSLTDGRWLRAAIAAVTPLPVCYVIMTHVHPDHVFGGGASLADHAVFVGHANLPRAMAARAAYDAGRLEDVIGAAATGMPVVPTRLVRDRDAVDLGGRTLELQAHGIAHTDTDLTVLDRGTGTLWAGDLLFAGRVPALDGSLTGWLRELAALRHVEAVRAVPGHGPAQVPWPAGADDEERYLSVLLHDVRADIAKGEDIETAVRDAGQSERGRWALFDDYNGRNVTEAYQALQWE